MGSGDDARLADAIDVLLERRLPNGRWRAGGSYSTKLGTQLHGEAVDWRRAGASGMITLNALHALKLAGKLASARTA
jgi:hypothetical protein